MEQLSREGTINNIAMTNWLDSLDDEERKIFVDSVFDVIRSTECETMGELGSNKLKTTSEILRALSHLSPEQNKTIKFAMKQLAMNRRESLREN